MDEKSADLHNAFHLCFYAEEPRRVPGKPAMVRDCGMGT